MPKVKGVFENGVVRPEKKVSLKGTQEVLIIFKEKPSKSIVEELSKSRFGRKKHKEIQRIIEATEYGELFE